MKNKPLSIYIHIPFCKSKCFYCDFLSFANKEELYEKYIKALILEIKQNSYKYKGYQIQTIFIGGGTPTLLEFKFIIKIIEALNLNYDIFKNAEITIEGNPGTIDYNKLKNLRAIGINRLSLGLQAWQNRLLNTLGRIYSCEEFIKEFYLARNAGFKNINIDLMFSLPEQNLNDFEQTLINVIKLNPEHISAYSLIIEEGTPFYNLYADNKLKLPDDNLDREMYYIAKKLLKQNGYIHYEISNFAQSGFESKHNIVYWKQKEYIGFGLGAHSYIDKLRFHNTCNIQKYISNQNKIEDIQKNDSFDEMSEFMFLGLRLIKGISISEFKVKFGIDINNIYNKQIDECKKLNLIEQKDDFLVLTSRGIDVSNIVFEKFLIK